MLLCLPSPVSGPQQLVLNMVHLPLTAIALFFSAADRNIRTISTEKNGNVVATRDMVWYGTWCYALRFLIPMVSLLAAHSLALEEITARCEGQDCRGQVSAVTDVNMTFLTAHILLVSLSFVSRTDHLWNLKPRRSWPLLVAGSALMAAQLLYLLISLWVAGGAVPALMWIIYRPENRTQIQ